MSVFVDTGLFYALQNQRANRHESARTALGRVFAGQYGQAYTSDYVFDETVTLVRSRTGSFDEARIVGNRIRGVGDFPGGMELLFVGEEAFDIALETYERYDDHPLSFTDATTIALTAEHGIDAVLSFDRDFDGIVDRIDPGEIGEDSSSGSG